MNTYYHFKELVREKKYSLTLEVYIYSNIGVYDYW